MKKSEFEFTTQFYVNRLYDQKKYINETNERKDISDERKQEILISAKQVWNNLYEQLKEIDYCFHNFKYDTQS